MIVEIGNSFEFVSLVFRSICKFYYIKTLHYYTFIHYYYIRFLSRNQQKIFQKEKFVIFFIYL